MSLLGSMLLHRDAIGDVLPLLHRDESERFYRPDHRKLFETLVDMYDRGDAVDLVTVRNELDRRSLLTQIGGVDYLVQLAESVPSHLHAEHYARLVRDKAMLRDLIGAAGRISEEAYSHHEEAREILDRAEQLLFQVTDQRISEQATPIRDSLEEIFKQIESRDGHYITGLPTGFLELDDMLSGLQNGEMIIVAARPSMGKTAFGLNVAHSVAMSGKPAVFFSMEMSRQSVVQRLLCSYARVDSHKLRRGMLPEEDIQRLAGVCDELATVPLYVDDTPGMSVLELRAKARRLKSRHGITGIFVDYLQLMHSPGRSDSRQQEVSEISRGLKALARELNIPVVVMAQLNRNPEGRTDNRPRMSDLRESGAIEQDADVIALLHREDYYKRENCPEELKNVAEVIVDKQRNGPTGVVKLHFDLRFTRFDNLSYSAEPAYAPEGGYGNAPRPNAPNYNAPQSNTNAPHFNADGPGLGSSSYSAGPAADEAAPF
jgi:replicative DNA helicase